MCFLETPESHPAFVRFLNGYVDYMYDIVMVWNSYPRRGARHIPPVPANEKQSGHHWLVEEVYDQACSAGAGVLTFKFHLVGLLSDPNTCVCSVDL